MDRGTGRLSGRRSVGERLKTVGRRAAKEKGGEGEGDFGHGSGMASAALPEEA